MRVLLDENLPHGLRKLITGHQVSTVAHQGWTSLSNGLLVGAAEAAGFEVMLTADQNMPYQQNISHRSLSVVALPTNRLATLVTMIQEIVQAIDMASPGGFSRVELPSNETG